MVLRWMPVVIWVGVIFGLSSLPDLGPSRQPFTGSDKLVHIVEYGVLGFLFVRARRLPGGWRWRAAVVAAVFGLLVGGVDEWYQRSVPGRTSDAADTAADGLGAALGGLVQVQWRRWRSSMQERRG